MHFQLVVQFPAHTIESFDALVETEDSLAQALEPEHIVDGHDFGAGEANIFIHTNDPEAAFGIVQRTLGSKRIAEIKAAFRRFDSEKYNWLHPVKESARFEVS